MKWMPRAGSLTFAGACARLLAIVTLFAVAAAVVTAQRSGPAGAVAVAIAAGVCGLGGALALAVAAWSRSGVPTPQRALGAVAGGMVFRMLLPLAAGVALG